MDELGAEQAQGVKEFLRSTDTGKCDAGRAVPIHASLQGAKFGSDAWHCNLHVTYALLRRLIANGQTGICPTETNIHGFS